MTARVCVDFRGQHLWATTEGYLTADPRLAGQWRDRAEAERVALAVQDNARGASVEVVADTTPEAPVTDAAPDSPREAP